MVCNEPASTSEPKIQTPIIVVPEAKRTKPKKEVMVNELQREIKETRFEVQTLRENLATLRFDQIQRLTYLENTLHHTNEKRTSLQNPSDEEDETDDPVTDMVQRKFLETINRINFRKWHSKVRIVISKDFEFEVIALIDSGAYLNYIQEGIIPSKYFKKTRERLTSASGGKM